MAIYEPRVILRDSLDENGLATAVSVTPKGADTVIFKSVFDKNNRRYKLVQRTSEGDKELLGFEYYMNFIASRRLYDLALNEIKNLTEEVACYQRNNQHPGVFVCLDRFMELINILKQGENTNRKIEERKSLDVNS